MRKKLFCCLTLALATCSYARTLVAGPETSHATSAEEPPTARDPTMPSQKILERLQAQIGSTAMPSAPTDATVEAEPPEESEICLKAIVLTDRDHGVAMLEYAGRKLSIRLARELLVTSTQNMSSAARLNGFAIQGVTYYLEDFSDRTLLLRSADGTLLVQ